MQAVTSHAYTQGRFNNHSTYSLYRSWKPGLVWWKWNRTHISCILGQCTNPYTIWTSWIHHCTHACLCSSLPERLIQTTHYTSYGINENICSIALWVAAHCACSVWKVYRMSTDSWETHKVRELNQSMTSGVFAATCQDRCGVFHILPPMSTGKSQRDMAKMADAIYARGIARRPTTSCRLTLVSSRRQEYNGKATIAMYVFTEYLIQSTLVNRNYFASNSQCPISCIVW